MYINQFPTKIRLINFLPFRRGGAGGGGVFDHWRELSRPLPDGSPSKGEPGIAKPHKVFAHILKRPFSLGLRDKVCKTITFLMQTP